MDASHPEELRAALRNALRPPARHGRGIIDAILPKAIADRNHAIMMDPYLPLYRDLCLRHGVYPHDFN